MWAKKINSPFGWIKNWKMMLCRNSWPTKLIWTLFLFPFSATQTKAPERWKRFICGQLKCENLCFSDVEYNKFPISHQFYVLFLFSISFQLFSRLYFNCHGSKRERQTFIVPRRSLLLIFIIVPSPTCTSISSARHSRAMLACCQDNYVNILVNYPKTIA